MRSRRVLISFAAAVIAATAVLGMYASEAIAGSSLKILRSWPPVIDAVRIIEQYEKQVEKAAAGDGKTAKKAFGAHVRRPARS